METSMVTPNATPQEKNLLAMSILLAGLFVGSLFVDFIQLLNGDGFSAWATKNFNILESGGKTWVSYGDPKVSLQVISDADCDACDPSEALVWLRRVIPTIEAKKIDINDPYGKELAEHFGILTLPAFVFSRDIVDTNFYAQASSLFDSRQNRYFFDMGKIGLPVGRYLKLPTVYDNDIIIGPHDATVTIVLYTDFECPHCKTYHENLRSVWQNFDKQVRIVYKHLPLSFHVQAENAGQAVACAHEQGKFDIYSRHLYDKQGEWSKTSGLQKFKDYAWWLKLDYRAFADCLDSNRFKDTIVRDREEAQALSLTATPASFIGETFVDEAIDTAEIKRLILAELAKKQGK